MTNDKSKLQSQIEVFIIQKQEYEDYLKDEEPAVIDAQKQIKTINPKLIDFRDQMMEQIKKQTSEKMIKQVKDQFENKMMEQTENLTKYLKLMEKTPEIANAKNQIIVIANNISQLEKQ